MRRAYNEMYLEDAMRNLGTAFDFAKHSYHIEMDDFYMFFVNSGIAGQFENGVPKYVSGISGIEIVLEVLNGRENIRYEKDYISYDYSCEYWCGWILAYFQWYYSINFDDLAYYLKMKDLERLYNILHETSEIKAVEVISAHIRNKNLISRLKYHRLKNDLSQKELSEESGVSLRMIQQYEQRKKDINMASTSSLYFLARVLNCQIENLMEWDFKDEIPAQKN
ncbi:MAG: helix-turn-helix transcriptional regulator [Erysipelotrichaceae bacterium]|nr:helix-turn-helix transcriptional regulator [Erysipelotrichaceae bacterium]